MTDTNVLQFSQPGTFTDRLTEVLRNGARALLAQAVEAEVASLLERYADEVTNECGCSDTYSAGVIFSLAICSMEGSPTLRKLHLAAARRAFEQPPRNPTTSFLSLRLSM